MTQAALARCCASCAPLYVTGLSPGAFGPCCSCFLQSYQSEDNPIRVSWKSASSLKISRTERKVRRELQMAAFLVTLMTLSEAVLTDDEAAGP